MLTNGIFPRWPFDLPWLATPGEHFDHDTREMFIEDFEDTGAIETLGPFSWGIMIYDALLPLGCMRHFRSFSLDWSTKCVFCDEERVSQ